MQSINCSPLPALISNALQVIFLDSDNVAVADVGQLFLTPQYTRYGALLWPDYWESSAAPDLLKILGLTEAPLGTTESGQMVFDKARYESTSAYLPHLVQPDIGEIRSYTMQCGTRTQAHILVIYAGSGMRSCLQHISTCTPDSTMNYFQISWVKVTRSPLPLHLLQPERHTLKCPMPSGVLVRCGAIAGESTGSFWTVGSQRWLL